MTTDEHEQVCGPTVDGPKWHLIRQRDETQVETSCGLTYDVRDYQVDISEIGESPSVSGTTICYSCVKSNDCETETVKA